MKVLLCAREGALADAAEREHAEVVGRRGLHDLVVLALALVGPEKRGYERRTAVDHVASEDDAGIVDRDHLHPTRCLVRRELVVEANADPRTVLHTANVEVKRDLEVVLPLITHRQLAVCGVHVHGAVPPGVEDLRARRNGHGSAVHVERREALRFELRRVEVDLGRVLDLQDQLPDVHLVTRVGHDRDRCQLVHAVDQSVVIPLEVDVRRALVDDDARRVIVPADRD